MICWKTRSRKGWKDQSFNVQTSLLSTLFIQFEMNSLRLAVPSGLERRLREVPQKCPPHLTGDVTPWNVLHKSNIRKKFVTLGQINSSFGLTPSSVSHLGQTP